MKNKTLFTIIFVTILSLIFWGLFFQKISPKPKVLQPLEAIELNPGADEYRLDGKIKSLNLGKKISEMEIELSFPPKIFKFPPSCSQIKKIIILPSSAILEGKLGSEETQPLKGPQDLKVGDVVIVKTRESIKELPVRDIFSAIWIKVLKD
jgi:hypothetical protein